MINYNKILLFLIIIFIFYIINLYLIKIEKFDNNKNIIWMYWETLPGKKKPGYIDLCINSVKFNCGKCFDIIVLDNKKILEYPYPDINNCSLLGKSTIPGNLGSGGTEFNYTVDIGYNQLYYNIFNGGSISAIFLNGNK
jgi:hypothetical protein